jgi:hypothetical protein
VAAARSYVVLPSRPTGPPSHEGEVPHAPYCRTPDAIDRQQLGSLLLVCPSTRPLARAPTNLVPPIRRRDPLRRPPPFLGVSTLSFRPLPFLPLHLAASSGRRRRRPSWNSPSLARAHSGTCNRGKREREKETLDASAGRGNLATSLIGPLRGRRTGNARSRATGATPDPAEQASPRCFPLL